MRIHRLEMENFKRIKVVSIDPDANTVVIGGRNAQGKSSVLDGIMAALAGRQGTKELVRPIRDGEKKASVVLELDDLRVERKWTPSGSTLTVGPREGNAKLNSPQAVLDKLIGALAFDPLAFAESDPKKQVETLIDLIGREQFDKIADARRGAYDARTDVNRDVKRLRNEVESRSDAREVEPVDVTALIDLRDQVARKVGLRQRWQSLEAEIDRLREEQAGIAAEAASLPDGDPSDLMDQVKQADETNRQAQRWIDLQAARESLHEAEHKADSLTEMIESVDRQKAELISSASLPVEGLAFDEDGVTFNGVPFQQSSAAERLKVSVAMAMAMNPDLRVICIRDASLLDDDSKQALVDMATAHDYQIWYEVVGDPGEIGVVLEDGEVKA